MELGSGQSFMIAGLLRNTNSNSISKAPFLGDLPILGMLFRSTKFQRQETELVIIVTPYLVRPVSGQLATPTNGYRATDGRRSRCSRARRSRASAVRPLASRLRPPRIVGGAAAAPGFKL